MDGGGRLLRSLGGFGAIFARSPLVPVPYTVSPLAFAGSHDPRTFPVLPQAAPRLPKPRRTRHMLRRAIERAAASRILGTGLVIAFLIGATAFGAVRGGAYASFVAANGTLPDVIARFCGFPIKAVTITGMHELSEHELLDLAGVSPRNSLLFLDVSTIRARLKADPLIKEASVSKLFPNRLLIEVVERHPYALWQRDGQVSVVAADGMPITPMRDAKFETLPLVVGIGANDKLEDYVALLDSAGELRDRIRAGILVSKRRWTLKMNNGVEIDLPEVNPGPALSRFALLEHDGHILEKDIISLDLRIPGRVTVRLTAEASAARAAALAKKKKGSPS